MKDPRLALFYSVVAPGLGQIYLGERAKGWTFLCMGAGVAVSLIISHTAVACFLMGGIYLAVMIPAALDAFQTASGRPRTFSGDTIPYVIVMLLSVGPFAIPLLWQSQKFSPRAKIVWTIVVIGIALLSIVAMTFVASFLERIMKSGQMT
jgi:TM2 domain-containing membrane protein YozV